MSMVEIRFPVPEQLYQQVQQSARDAGMTIEDYLVDTVSSRERSVQDELAIEGYQAMAVETLEFAASAMATVRDTWPNWGEESPHRTERPAKTRPISENTCRGEILQAARIVVRRNGRPEFTMQEIVEEMKQRGSVYAESTIRTHIGSSMCANAPRNHGTVYNDIERVAHGWYRLSPWVNREDEDGTNTTSR